MASNTIKVHEIKIFSSKNKIEKKLSKSSFPAGCCACFQEEVRYNYCISFLCFNLVSADWRGPCIWQEYFIIRARTAMTRHLRFKAKLPSIFNVKTPQEAKGPDWTQNLLCAPTLPFYPSKKKKKTSIGKRTFPLGCCRVRREQGERHCVALKSPFPDKDTAAPWG